MKMYLEPSINRYRIMPGGVHLAGRPRHFGHYCVGFRFRYAGRRRRYNISIKARRPAMEDDTTKYRQLELPLTPAKEEDHGTS